MIMTERNLPPDTSVPSPDIEGSPLSPAAEKALAAAEAKAEARREEIAQQDAELRARAASGPSASSSGMRVAPPKSRVVHAPPIAVPTPGGGVAVVRGIGDGTEAAFAPPHSISQETRKQATQAAGKFMDEMNARAAEQKRGKRTDLMWYVRCHVCGGPGIWIYKLSSNLKPEDWATSYKPAGVMWPSKTVFCQCCYTFKGREVPLKMLHTTDPNGRVRLLRPYPRMIEEISIDEYNRLMGQSDEPETETADAVAP